MKARLDVAGHPLHAQLIVFPLGLLRISPLWDILRLSTDRPLWGAIAYWTIATGVISAFVAAIPGLLDYGRIPSGTRASRVGRQHLVLNLVLVGLLLLSLLLRSGDEGSYANADISSMLPGWIAVGLTVISGWLGGDLAAILDLGVHQPAAPNAPYSLPSQNDPRTSVGLRQEPVRP
jgi:uncharacterized membrane protein